MKKHKKKASEEESMATEEEAIEKWFESIDNELVLPLVRLLRGLQQRDRKERAQMDHSDNFKKFYSKLQGSHSSTKRAGLLSADMKFLDFGLIKIRPEFLIIDIDDLTSHLEENRLLSRTTHLPCRSNIQRTSGLQSSR